MVCRHKWENSLVNIFMFFQTDFQESFIMFFVNLVCLEFCKEARDLFVCFVALRPKSTAMVIAGRSVHLTTIFPGQA